MAKKAKEPEMVWVRALSHGQRPDGVWVDESSAPFRIDADLVSENWMEKLTKAEADNLSAELAESGGDEGDEGDNAVLEAKLASMTDQRDALLGEVVAITKERDAHLVKAEVVAKAAKPADPPPSGPAGDKLTSLAKK